MKNLSNWYVCNLCEVANDRLEHFKDFQKDFDEGENMVIGHNHFFAKRELMLSLIKNYNIEFSDVVNLGRHMLKGQHTEVVFHDEFAMDEANQQELWEVLYKLSDKARKNEKELIIQTSIELGKMTEEDLKEHMKDEFLGLIYTTAIKLFGEDKYNDVYTYVINKVSVNEDVKFQNNLNKINSKHLTLIK